MSKRKNIEAWAETLRGQAIAVHLEKVVTESWASNDREIYADKVGVIRLVEHDPRKEAVVRAAIRYVLGDGGSWADYDELEAAIRRYQNGTKRRAK